MEKELTPAEKHYLSMKKAQQMYHERKRQEKKANGTYRPVGRPRKVKGEGVCEKVENESAKIV